MAQLLNTSTGPRSNNITDTSLSNRINEFYREAVTTGYAPGNYCKVQILGDERVGKTSLRKNLMGEKFDPEQPSTVGIDTRMCNVKDVNENWQERVGDDFAAEFNDIVRWFCSKKYWEEDKDHEVSKWKSIALNTLTICFLLGLAGVVLTLVFLVSVPIENSLSSVVWLSCITLLVTKEVKLYLMLSGIADAIFTLNLIGYLMFESGLSRRLWGGSCFFSAMQVGITGVFETVTGQNVILGINLLSLTPGDSSSSDRWNDHLSIYDIIIMALSYVIGRHLVKLSENLAGHYNIHVFFFAELSQSSKNLLTSLIFIPISIMLPNMFMVGLCCGIGSTVGVTLGRKSVSVSLFKKVMEHRWISLLLQVVYGLMLVKLCGRELPFQLLSQYRNVLQSGLLPLVIADVYRNHLLDYTPSSVAVASQVLHSQNKELPLNLSLWDFAGQELYYNTHHTFMSVHAVYIIVFNLEDFSDITTSPAYWRCPQPALRRIKFWMESVRQHANASILLVGTHSDCIDEQVIEKIQLYVKDSLHSQNLIFNGKSCFFVINNRKDSTSGTDDLDSLRRTVQEEARSLQRMSKEYPIRWRRFHELIEEWRLEQTHPPYITLIELQRIAVKFHIHTTKELIAMLTFFHDNGEIIYDSVDSVLRQFVVLDPQVMIDVMEALVVVPNSADMGKFSNAWQYLERTGILQYKLLEHMIVSRLSLSNDINVHVCTEVFVGMLHAKDLICKVKRRNTAKSTTLTMNDRRTEKHSRTHDEIYVVPSMLPSWNKHPPLDMHDWNKRLYVYFGPMLPDAVFLRLMSRCASYSDVVSVCEDQCQLFSDGGFFTLGTNYFFMLRRIQPCDEQYLVEVSIKAAHDWHPLEVLKYLCNILDTLRCRDFPGLQYTAGVMCPCEAPHQGCKDERMMHVLDLHTEMETEESTTCIHRWCNGREIHADVEQLESPLSSTEDNLPQPITVNVQGDNNFVVVGGKQSRIVINRGESSCKEDNIDSEGEKDEPESSTELGIDVFISSSPHDEGWVQETLVRYLTGPPHYLVVCLNQYDVHSQALHVRRQNAKQIETSAVFLAVCSRYYRKDATGRLTFEREVARRCYVPIVGVTRDCDKSDVADMFDVDEVSFSSGDREVMGQSLDLLSEKILENIKEKVQY